MPFEFRRFDELPEVILIEPRRFGDDRGWFMETYKCSDFSREGISLDFVQDNHSRSTQLGVLRGLHFQREPKPQGKLVRCVAGRIFDVAVDIRQGSSTYTQWVAAELTEENQRMLWVPPGFAHGFCTLSEVADVVYKVTQEYDPELDSGCAWNDPSLGIEWPNEDPVLSEKDAALPRLEQADAGFTHAGV